MAKDSKDSRYPTTWRLPVLWACRSANKAVLSIHWGASSHHVHLPLIIRNSERICSCDPNMGSHAMKAYSTMWKNRHTRATDHLIEEGGDESVERSDLLLRVTKC